MRNATLIYLNLTKQGKQTSKLRCKHTARWGCLQGNVYIDFPEPTPYYLHIYIDLVSLGNHRSSRSQPPRLRYPSIHSADIDLVSLGNHRSSRSQRPRLRYPSIHSAESAYSDHIIDQAYGYIFELVKYYLLYAYEISLD